MQRELAIKNLARGVRKLAKVPSPIKKGRWLPKQMFTSRKSTKSGYQPMQKREGSCRATAHRC